MAVENTGDSLKDREGKPESGEFLGLKEFLSLVVKLISTIAGFAALFAVLGYAIILSFMSKMKLYGITSFPQEFFKEASIKFMGDMFETFGRHPFCTLTILAFTSSSTYLCLRYKRHVDEKIARSELALFMVSTVVVLVILATLRLERLPERLYFITEIRSLMLFLVSFPMLCGLFIYLAFRFRIFMAAPFKFYYLMSALFLSLFIAIPIGYGDNIFDIDIYPVAGIDYNDSPNIEALRKMQHDIDAQGQGSLFFLMGHTTDREVFFDNQDLTPPAKMVLVDRNLIKFLRISRTRIDTLRGILREQRSTDPIPTSEGDVKIEALPASITDIIDKGVMKQP